MGQSECDADEDVRALIPKDPGPQHEPEQDEQTALDRANLCVHKPSPYAAILPQKAADKWGVNLPHVLVSTNWTLEKFHVLKWKEISLLSRLIAAPCFRRVRLAGDDRALYESFYRSFPHDMVTKARFMGVTRAVFGVEEDAGVKSTLSREEVELCRHLERMQYAYELSAENVPMLNWRLLLVGLHMFQFPLVAMREHLSWGFRVFGSAGFLDPLVDSTTVKASDAALMLTQLMRNQASMRLVSERFRQAQILEPTGTLTPANLRHRMTSARMSHRRFLEFIMLPPMRALFEKATEHTTFLEEMATPIYRECVFKRRKKDNDRKKVERLRYYHRTKRTRHAFGVWVDTARVMRRTRVLMVAAFKRIAKVQRAHAFARLKIHAIQSWAASEIQRMVRGMRGRRIAAEKWTLVQAAIKVQGAFRLRSHFVRFMNDLRRRHRTAIRLQRVYRGRVGRIAAKKRLLEFYYEELERIQKERDAFRDFVRSEMAKRLQRLFRSIVQRAKERRAAGELKEREIVELEMQERASDAVRQIRRYKQDVTARYDKMREESEYRTRRKKIDGAEKNKVLHLRRQRQWEAFKQARIQIKERHKRESADAYEALKTKWEATIADRTRLKRLFVSQVLALDEPGEYRALQKQLKLQVAEREKELNAKYKQTKVAVPKHEVRERATHEVVDDEVEKERKLAEADWLKAEADFLDDRDVQEEERTLKESSDERQRRARSAVLIQSAYRMFTARKLLKAEICRCFVKEFDSKKQLPMYRNVFTRGSPSARKPYGLGSEDLEYPDQWVLIDDEVVGQPYFFNPRRIRQSWEKPDECQCCDVCAASGRIVFAAFWNGVEDSYICQRCYDSRLASMTDGESNFSSDHYYPYDGSKSGGY